MSFNRLEALISRSNLKHNFKFLYAKAKLPLLPMVKANGYGHGVKWVAEVLKNEKHLRGFGVATLHEGAQLRSCLEKSAPRLPILVFSGSTPWTNEMGRFCQKYHLTPVLTDLQSLERFMKAKWSLKLPYHLKFNTGMNRLGINMEALPSITETFSTLSPRELPEGILSHLACGENPSHPLSRLQLKNFKQLRECFLNLNARTEFHLGNSGALLTHKDWKLHDLTHFVRPGISLYGISPSPKLPVSQLKPVMTLMARVCDTRQVPAKSQIGYGATYKTTRSLNTAILAGGYADGIMRGLSNRQEVWIGGKREKFLGIISMDLSCVEASKNVKSGDWAEIFGTRIPLWSQAQSLGTIPYELLTRVSDRVERIEV